MINLAEQFKEAFTTQYENKEIIDSSKMIKTQIINTIRTSFNSKYDELLEILQSPNKYNFIKKKFDQICIYR